MFFSVTGWPVNVYYISEKVARKKWDRKKDRKSLQVVVRPITECHAFTGRSLSIAN